MNRRKLLLDGLFKLVAGFLLTGLLMFLPAGTLRYPNAWLFIALLFIPMVILGTVLLCKAPELLAKRLNAKEKEAAQRSVVAWSAVIYIAGFVLSGLAFRFGWLQLPRWLVIAAAVALVASYALYVEVMRENAYLSRTVEVQKDQKVVDTGLYGVVRHPMYTATILMNLAIPLVLGSAVPLPLFLLYIPLIVKRIRNEEAVLQEGLAGYTGYMQKVKYRLIPFVW